MELASIELGTHVWTGVTDPGLPLGRVDLADALPPSRGLELSRTGFRSAPLVAESPAQAR